MTRPSLLALALLLACKGPSAAAPPPQSAKPDAQAAWKTIADAPDRSGADRKLDLGRHPVEMLEFLDPKPGMKAADLGAGGGYTTELLARAVAPGGVVYMQNEPSWLPLLKDGIAERFTHAAAKNIVRVDRTFEEPLLPEAKDLDLVVMNVIYHDVVNMPVSRLRMNRAIFNALKPGGRYVVGDSSAKPGSGISATSTLHRIDEQVVRDEVQQAGFRLVQEGKFLRNPEDARDWNSAPLPSGERRGTSDRFMLKFVRPEGSQPWPLAPVLKLPPGARPVRVTAEMTIDPRKDDFEGSEQIELAVDQPGRLLWLNADGLKILDTDPKATVIDAPPGFVGLQFEKTIPSSVRIHWTGKLSRTDTDGAFRQEENGEWYAITHLEPLGARRVWPSFDEPAFKNPWRMSLKIRKSDTAYFNTPVESTAEQGDWQMIRFAETRPLPSYLLAFGVGPWERADAGKTKSGAPVGIVVSKGKLSWAKYSARSSPLLMNLLEDYFAIPYPYPKLDLIEVPLGTGAMENPGLITFNQRINLAKPGQESPQFQRRAAGVEAHEFAHLWFGDLVTTAWWDDIWLNEAFATWMASKILERFDAKWNEPADRVNSMNFAMSQDRLLSARRIRQPAESEGDIKTAFDGITYQKGAAVIGMFEQFVGPELFRKGVQRYLRAHADGNATAKEFLAAISAEAGKDVAPAFSTFLDQAGLPIVSAKVSCDKGKGKLLLEQKRYLPLGTGDPPPEQLWQIPICVRSGVERRCTLMTEKTASIDLKNCPEWLVPNASASGYYRSALDDAAFARLSKNVARLTVAERMQLLYDASAAARAGALDYARALELVPVLAADRDRHVVVAALHAVDFLRDGNFFPDELRPRFAKFVRDVFGTRARALGFAERKTDDDDTRILRPALLYLVGDQGEDPELRDAGKRVALRWLEDHSSTSPELASVALHLAVIAGGRALFDRLHQAARNEKDRVERQRMLDALGGFRDPAIAQAALPIALSDEFDPRESIALVWSAAESAETRDLALDFVKKNFLALVARMPRDWGAGAVGVAKGYCDEKAVKDVAGFFGPRAGRFAGGERRFAQALENLRQCAAFRGSASPGVTAFLEKR